jgi:hypothetical protein
MSFILSRKQNTSDFASISWQEKSTIFFFCFFMLKIFAKIFPTLAASNSRVLVNFCTTSPPRATRLCVLLHMRRVRWCCQRGLRSRRELLRRSRGGDVVEADSCSAIFFQKHFGCSKPTVIGRFLEVLIQNKWVRTYENAFERRLQFILCQKIAVSGKPSKFLKKF